MSQSAAFEPTGKGDEKAYELVFKQSVRTLDVLDRRVEAQRTGYLAILAFVGTATAFLAGSALLRYERDSTLRWLAFVATVLAAAALSLAVYDLWPRQRPAGIDANTMAEYVDKWPGAYVIVLAHMATKNSEQAEKVRKSVRQTAIRFALFLGLSFSSLVVWILLAWIGTPITTR